MNCLTYKAIQCIQWLQTEAAINLTYPETLTLIEEKYGLNTLQELADFARLW
jgi:hypothetical protein